MSLQNAAQVNIDIPNRAPEMAPDPGPGMAMNNMGQPMGPTNPMMGGMNESTTEMSNTDQAVADQAVENAQLGDGSPAAPHENNEGIDEMMEAGYGVGGGLGPPNEPANMTGPMLDGGANMPEADGMPGTADMLMDGSVVNERFNLQTGGDGFRFGVDQEMIGGQPVVNGYDNELATCGGYGNMNNDNNDNMNNNQVGGGSPFNYIHDPESNNQYSIFSKDGKELLKRYVKAYKNMQSGGAALLPDVDPNASGALYDGLPKAGAEYFPDACNRTYDASQDVWAHTQVGGGGDCGNNKSKKSY